MSTCKQPCLHILATPVDCSLIFKNQITWSFHEFNVGTQRIVCLTLIIYKVDVFSSWNIEWELQACFIKHLWSKFVDTKYKNTYVRQDPLYKVISFGQHFLSIYLNKNSKNGDEISLAGYLVNIFILWRLIIDLGDKHYLRIQVLLIFMNRRICWENAQELGLFIGDQNEVCGSLWN